MTSGEPSVVAPEVYAQLVREYGDHLPLDRACALLAAEEQPGLDPDEPLRELDRLAASVHIPRSAETVEQIARLNQALFVREGFRGDGEDYEDPRNSLLDQVLTRRRGLPILLSVVYMEVARRCGVGIDGIGFPGHFLVSPSDADPRFYVDPFAGGRIVRREELKLRLAKLLTGKGPFAVEDERLLEALSARATFVRINNNLKSHHLQGQDLASALRAVNRLCLLEPSWAEQRRDQGLLLLELGRTAEGRNALRAYLRERPDADDADSIREHLGVGERGERD
jgi:regulator of sirC expression with transglutaminase-like and TPR domain